ncbi:MAG: hypothetical protein H0V37_14155 [Chloroflexia bacterium]|nr:hypothetical protein [Chloroflexia bacterium]
MTDLTNGDTIYIDRTTRTLSREEMAIVDEVLGVQMPGYRVVPNARSADSQANVSARDFSPPLADLKVHFGRLARSGATGGERPPSPRSLVDRGADLRMYRVRHEDWPDEVAPVTVIVSMRERDRKVIASS